LKNFKKEKLFSFLILLSRLFLFIFESLQKQNGKQMIVLNLFCFV
jgi:hypothetical protein